MKRSILSQLLCTFMKIGLFTFGGGYAMIAMMEEICVGQKRWISHDELMDITVVAESTPGPIAINCATYVGYQQAGFAGAVAATFGVVAPSFGVILALSAVLEGVVQLPLLAGALRGIQVAVGMVVLGAGVTMVKKMRKKRLSVAIMAASFAAVVLSNLAGWHLSTIALMAACAAVGLAGYGLGLAGRKGGDSHG